MKEALTPQETLSAKKLINLGLAEDVGPGDLATEWLVDKDLRATMLIACGAALLPLVFPFPETGVLVANAAPDGKRLQTGDAFAKLQGPAHILLTRERVALNMLQRLSGIATLTHQYVTAVQGTKAVILDTRKTAPGFRLLDKYAVRTGGGQNHRIGLYDMALIKDNHIALCGGMAQAIKRINSCNAVPEIPVAVECDTLEQLQEALTLGIKRILLDNMPPPMLREAVRLNNKRARLEASGGVTLDTVRDIAETGVDFISVGALTHSVKAADLGADITFE